MSSDIAHASAKTPVKLGVLRDNGNVGSKPLMTGSTVLVQSGEFLPANADVVVPKANTFREPSSPVVSILQSYEAGQGVQKAGSNAAADSVLIQSGTELTRHDVRLLTLLGITHVQVAVKPTVSLVFSTPSTESNKLKAVESWVSTFTQQAGADFGEFVPVKTGRLSIAKAIQVRETPADLVIVLLDNEQPSGPALEAIRANTKVMFERINISPMGPSMLGYSDNTSILLCGTANLEMVLEMLVRPAIKEMLGCFDNARKLISAKSALTFKAALGGEAFLPAIAEYKDAGIWVRPIKTHTPWDYSTEQADGYILVQEKTNTIKRGDLVDFLLITR